MAPNLQGSYVQGLHEQAIHRARSMSKRSGPLFAHPNLSSHFADASQHANLANAAQSHSKSTRLAIETLRKVAPYVTGADVLIMDFPLSADFDALRPAPRPIHLGHVAN
jgi:hypothetical protein